MIQKEQMEVWILELSNFFVKNYKYQVITLNQETQEVWLINNDHKAYPIILLTAIKIEDLDVEAVQAHRRALSLLFKSEYGGINISVNPDTVQYDEGNVLVGVNSIKAPEAFLAEFSGLESVLQITKNFGSAKSRAVQSLNKSMTKLQKITNLRKNKVTTILSGIMLGVYLFVSIFAFMNDINGITALVMFGAYTKPMVSLAHEWWRIITPMFLHADILHLLMNLLAFKNIATIVEPELGWKRYLLVMVSGVIFGTGFTFIQGAHVIAVGASAGIYALLGVLLVMMYERELFKNKLVLRQVMSILSINLLLSIMPGVSFIGHLGGFYIGIFYGFAFSKRSDWKFIRDFGKGMTIASFMILAILLVTSTSGVLPSQTELEVIKQWDALGFKHYARRLFMLLIQ